MAWWWSNDHSLSPISYIIKYCCVWLKQINELLFSNFTFILQVTTVLWWLAFLLLVGRITCLGPCGFGCFIIICTWMVSTDSDMCATCNVGWLMEWWEEKWLRDCGVPDSILVMHDAPVTVAQLLLQFCHFYSITIFSSSSKNKEKKANELKFMQVLYAYTFNRKGSFKTN
jgi:hypothetical protein